MPLGKTYYTRQGDHPEQLGPPRQARDHAARVAEALVNVLSCSVAHTVARRAAARLADGPPNAKSLAASNGLKVELANLAQSSAYLAREVRALLDRSFEGIVLGDEPAELGLEAHELEILKDALGYDRAP